MMPDATGARPGLAVIAPGGPASLSLRTPGQRLVAAVRARGLSAAASRDAGRYLCNYLCWRVAETASTSTGLRLAAFIHVPPVRRGPRRKRDKAMASLNDLTVAGDRALVALVAAARR
jgi:pyroglutamyl-peptidase